MKIFYKNYNALYKTAFNSIGRETAANTLGNGFAKGFELFWRDKKTIKNLDYWISYSYLDTKRDFNNYPSLLEPSFATKHTASFVAKQFVLKWKTGFNASYTFATGRPYYNFQYNNITNKTEIATQGKTINYNNLSLSLNYLPYLGNTSSKKFLVFVVSLSNVLGFNQVFNYNFSTNGQNRVAITPNISFAITRTATTRSILLVPAESQMPIPKAKTNIPYIRNRGMTNGAEGASMAMSSLTD